METERRERNRVIELTPHKYDSPSDFERRTLNVYGVSVSNLDILLPVGQACFLLFAQDGKGVRESERERERE